MFKKLLVSLFIGLTVFLSFAPYLTPAKAQTTWYNQDFFSWYDKVYNTNTSPPDQIFGERYTAAQVQWIVWSFLSLPINLLGSTVQPIALCFFGVLGNVGDIVTCGVNAITFVKNVISTINTALGTAQINSNTAPLARLFDAKERSLSGIGYVERLAEKFSPVTEVHAQTGYGFTAINALQTYWIGFRNMAYAIMVLVVIIFAFMIMFRVKLNPQTVVSVQSALPKVIMALILATFSYAIAGFLVDLTYVVSGLFASLVTMAGFGTSTIAVYNWIVPTNASSILGNFLIFGYLLLYTVVFLVAVVWSFVATLSGLSIFGMLSSIFMLLVVVWLLILMLWYTIKIPWVLIKNLVSIYLSIVVAPIQIVAGALVTSLGFGKWLRKLIAELMVFPVTGLLMFLSWATLINSYAVNAGVIGQNLGFGQASKLWAPPIVGSTADMSGILWLAVSFSMIALLPKVVDMMKGMIMGERFSFGTAIGEAYGPIGGIAKGASGTAQGAALGGGAVWLGNKLEGRGNYYVQKVGKALTGYGNRSLGGAFGEGGNITKTEEPGAPRK